MFKRTGTVLDYYTKYAPNNIATNKMTKVIESYRVLRTLIRKTVEERGAVKHAHNMPKPFE